MNLLISIIVFFILKKIYLTYTPEHLQYCYIAMFVIIFFLSRPPPNFLKITALSVDSTTKNILEANEKRIVIPNSKTIIKESSLLFCMTFYILIKIKFLFHYNEIILFFSFLD